jgi:hypothetical protein
MFWDDIELVNSMVERHGPVFSPYVECGGLEAPVIADYARTIVAMKEIPHAHERGMNDPRVYAAQHERYIQIQRPLDGALPGYLLEDPAVGGLPIERLAEKYKDDRAIGTAVLLSVLEHVANPFLAIAKLREAMQVGGLAIVSTPFMFPEHYGPEDCFRFTPTGLRHVFDAPGWSVCEAGWRLRIAADAGVRCIRTGKPQAVESCFIVARAVA